MSSKFICEKQPIKTHHVRFCAHNLMDTFSLADETVVLYLKLWVELPWRSGSVMDCHATALGSIPGGNGVFTELHVLSKGQ